MRTRIGPPASAAAPRAAAASAPGAVRERDEERVALRVDLDAAVPRERVPQHPPVLGQRLRIPLRAELVQQPRRALDVREQEGDRAGGEIRTSVTTSTASSSDRGLSIGSCAGISAA